MPIRININGVTYDSVEAMPPGVRKMYDQTLSQLPVKKNEIKLSFQLTGPGFSIRKTGGKPGRSTPAIPSTTNTEEPVVRMTSNPIEPSSTEGGIRVALIVGGCGVIGFLFWLLTRAR